MTVEDLRASGTPFSLSFSGSGFLALYQVGVVQSLLELAPELLKSACKVYGSSAGSLIAAAVVCGISLDDLKEFFFATAKEARKTILGPLSPKCSLLAYQGCFAAEAARGLLPGGFGAAARLTHTGSGRPKRHGL